MPVPTSMSDLSVTAATCNPPGGEIIGTLADDYHRSLQSIVRRESAKGADIGIISGILTPGTDGNYFTVSTSSAMTGIASSWVGRAITCVFQNAVAISHSSNLILPGAANITTTVGQVLSFVQEALTPVWRCVSPPPTPSAGIVLLDTKTVAPYIFIPTAGQLAISKSLLFRINPEFLQSSTAELFIRFSQNGGASFISGASDYLSRLTFLSLTNPSSSVTNGPGFAIKLAAALGGSAFLSGEVFVDMVKGYVRARVSQQGAVQETVGEPAIAFNNFNAVVFSTVAGTLTGKISMYGMI